MASIPGLRSPYERVGKLIYFGRMLDKIRLHAAGKLPADYIENLGDGKIGFADGRCCRFLRISYPDVVQRTLAGGTEEEIMAWALARGVPRSDEECYIWNCFMAKRGWRDERSAGRIELMAKNGFADKPIASIFDFIDFDEGRDPAPLRAWITGELPGS